MPTKDKFSQFRQQYKGVYIATKTPTDTKVLAQALDYQTLERLLEKKHLADKPIAVQYLEPKHAICAY